MTTWEPEDYAKTLKVLIWQKFHTRKGSLYFHINTVEIHTYKNGIPEQFVKVCYLSETAVDYISLAVQEEVSMD